MTSSGIVPAIFRLRYLGLCVTEIYIYLSIVFCFLYIFISFLFLSTAFVFSQLFFSFLFLCFSFSLFLSLSLCISSHYFIFRLLLSSILLYFIAPLFSSVPLWFHFCSLLFPFSLACSYFHLFTFFFRALLSTRRSLNTQSRLQLVISSLLPLTESPHFTEAANYFNKLCSACS
jgi:hypothetical protein